MNGAVMQKLEQFGHVGPELLRLHKAAGGDVEPLRLPAAEEEAQHAPHLQPEQAEPRRNQAFAAYRHCLRAISDE
jgi:hypothetical protein